MSKEFAKTMKVNQELELNETPPFKILFWISDTENYTKSEVKYVVNYTGFHV